jgi:hypothetical protein
MDATGCDAASFAVNEVSMGFASNTQDATGGPFRLSDSEILRESDMNAKTI